MKRAHAPLGFSLLSALAAGLVLLGAACDISGGDEVVRAVSIRLSGTYVNGSGIPERQSGARVTRLSLTQSGDQLFAVDNEGTRWTGRIQNEEGASATVTLNGRTTTGVEVVITGNIHVEGTTATLGGLWVEPGLTANVSATATVAGSAAATPTPVPGATPTATPTP